MCGRAWQEFQFLRNREFFSSGLMRRKGDQEVQFENPWEKARSGKETQKYNINDMHNLNKYKTCVMKILKFEYISTNVIEEQFIDILFP